jgi:hypothetical protein
MIQSAWDASTSSPIIPESARVVRSELQAILLNRLAPSLEDMRPLRGRRPVLGCVFSQLCSPPYQARAVLVFAIRPGGRWCAQYPPMSAF